MVWRRDPPSRRSDIVGVTEGRATWYLDWPSGRVTLETMDGTRTQVTRVRGDNPIETACALESGAIAFVDSAHPDTMYVLDPAAGHVTTVIPLAPSPLVTRGAQWSGVQVGGSYGGGCVVYAPTMRAAVIVSDAGGRLRIARIDLRSDAVRAAAHRPWYSSIDEALTGQWAGDEVLDATTFTGGVAVLVRGYSQDTGRLVHLFNPVGEYVTTVRLLHAADRIAGADQSLLVLRQHGERVYIAGYPWPAAARDVATEVLTHPGSRSLPPIQ